MPAGVDDDEARRHSQSDALQLGQAGGLASEAMIGDVVEIYCLRFHVVIDSRYPTTSVQSRNPDGKCGPITACSNSPAP